MASVWMARPSWIAVMAGNGNQEFQIAMVSQRYWLQNVARVDQRCLGGVPSFVQLQCCSRRWSLRSPFALPNDLLWVFVQQSEDNTVTYFNNHSVILLVIYGKLRWRKEKNERKKPSITDTQQEKKRTENSLRVWTWNSAIKELVHHHGRAKDLRQALSAHREVLASSTQPSKKKQTTGSARCKLPRVHGMRVTQFVRAVNNASQHEHVNKIQ